MTSVRFETFELDRGNRQLRRGGEPVELNGRYFDALALLISEQGRLVTKDRFMGEVWRGVRMSPRPVPRVTLPVRSSPRSAQRL